MKFGKTLAASVAVAATLAAGAALAQDKLVVAIYKSGTQQYFIDQAAGFTKAAEELGYKAQIINVEMDANLAISAVSDAIAAGAAAIAITAPGPGHRCRRGQGGGDGIPLIATDDPLVDGDGKPVPFAGFDGVAMGTKVGERAAELVKASGWLDGTDYGVLSEHRGADAVGLQRSDECRGRTTEACRRRGRCGQAGFLRWHHRCGADSGRSGDHRKPGCEQVDRLWLQR